MFYFSTLSLFLDNFDILQTDFNLCFQRTRNSWFQHDLLYKLVLLSLISSSHNQAEDHKTI